MKDSYSFDIDAGGLDVSYQKHYDAYCKIFDRCGLDYVAVEADSGAMGGSQSQEFMIASDAGEDYVVRCRSCGYAANLEKAVSTPSNPVVPDSEEDLTPEEFHTPGFKTIAEVSEFTKLPETSQMKSLVMVGDGKPILVMLRGDHQLSETKLASVLKVPEVRAAQASEIYEWFGANPGSLGPVGVKNMRVLADLALKGRRNLISGANKDDYHLRNVTPGEDFEPEYFDLRQVAAGDACQRCGATLELVKAVEIGHIFKLGYRYSESMGLRVLAENGKEVTPIMGSYGIGIERILTCAIELFHDKDGMALPPPIAPFTLVITPVNFADEKQKECALNLYAAAKTAGIDALLDDRDERPGVKFKDADLIGIPFRLTVGKKLSEGKLELVDRRTRQSEDVAVSAAIEVVQARLLAFVKPASLTTAPVVS
jgi:prolyl-tRNA synthetase